MIFRIELLMKKIDLRDRMTAEKIDLQDRMVEEKVDSLI